MTKIIIIVKNKFRISLICLLFPLLHAKRGKLLFWSVLSEGCYFRGDLYFRDFLTPVKGSLLSKLYGKWSDRV